jgi:Cu(I)/Ag(I) efflux system membrane fusion protein
MSLVRRQKGEAVPLPDGVLTRMQFSPYRVQLAGIQTAPLEFRVLRREVILTGFVEPSEPNSGAEKSSQVAVKADVYEKDWPFLTAGQAVEATSDLLPGHAPFQGKITRLGPYRTPDSRSLQVWLEIEDPKRELQLGQVLTARIQATPAERDWSQRALNQEWINSMTVDLVAFSLFAPSSTRGLGGAASLVRMAGPQAAFQRGLMLAIPESAIVDHGARKVVYIETGPGMFDGAEVVVGPRCGEFYPVLSGLEAGQRVATAGAFLIDAEARLNPAAAAGYFGASRSTASAPSSQSHHTPASGPPSTADRALLAQQKICPVSGEPLDSMGGPVRVEVAGRTVFVCCKACIEPLRKDPDLYLSKLPKPEK